MALGDALSMVLGAGVGHLRLPFLNPGSFPLTPAVSLQASYSTLFCFKFSNDGKTFFGFHSCAQMSNRTQWRYEAG